MANKLNISFFDYVQDQENCLNEGWLDAPKNILRGIGGAIGGFLRSKTSEFQSEAHEQLDYSLDLIFKQFCKNLENIEFDDHEGKKNKFDKKAIDRIYDKLKSGYKFRLYKVFDTSRMQYKQSQISPMLPSNPTPSSSSGSTSSSTETPETDSEESKKIEDKIKQENKEKIENWINNFSDFANFMLDESEEEEGKQFVEPKIGHYFSTKKFPFSTILAIKKSYTFIPLVINKSAEELVKNKSKKWADFIADVKHIFEKHGCDFNQSAYVEELKNQVKSFKSYNVGTIRELTRYYVEWRNLIKALKEISSLIDAFCEENSKDICVVRGYKGGHNLHINIQESVKKFNFSNWLLMRENKLL